MTDFIDGLARERRSRLSEAQQADLPAARWGLALSGGGIRSAIFCFGLLHSLARNKVFHRFDLLSTVSGGGYIGSTLGRLLHQAAHSPGQQPPAEAVEEALGDADQRWFTWWLRANGRYLIPHGTQDAFFAAATFGRNLAAVHFELGVLALLLGLVLAGFDLAAWSWVDDRSSAFSNEQVQRDWLLTTVTGWPTPWLLLPLPGALGAFAACAYWVYPSDGEQGIPGWRWMALLFAVLGLYGMHAGWNQLRAQWLIPLPVLATVAAILAMTIAAALIAGVLLLSRADPARVRNRLTAFLGWMLIAAVAILLAGCVDYLAWHLSLAQGGLQGQVAIGIGVAGVVLRVLLPKLAYLPGSFPPLLRRLLGALVNLAGLMVLAGLVIFWVSLVHGLVTQRLFVLGTPAWRYAWSSFLAFLVPALVLSLSSGSNLGFLNKSSLYSFYKARLVRGFLGAANGLRFGAGIDVLGVVPEVRDNESLVHVSRVHAGDDLRMSEYRPHTLGGPVHLVNVCANQTRDPRGGLFNQDRRGLSLTVTEGRTRIGLKDWEQLDARPAMTLGSWMAISGAAVSPGLGSATRPGIAALAMMAGLRLGYWWECRDASGLRRRIGKYKLLFSELLGRFDIERNAPWFLSDGGHFENTGAYALLREKCALVVLADCGADPRYAFGDLENLVRKARIDLQADIKFLKPKAPLDRGWEAFGSLSDIASIDSSASLALARIDYVGGVPPGFLVVVKPSMAAGLPVDLVNFKADHPAFPQEPTTDQFFDEAQWESYFRLGTVLGAVVNADLLDSVPDVAARCFAPDDGAMTPVPAPPADRAAAAVAAGGAVAAPAKRLPARILATGAVTASVSLGAIASLGLTAFQTIDSEARQRREAQKTDPQDVKELTRLYTDLLAANRDERGKATVTLAVALARVAEQVCDGPRVKGYRSSAQVNTILVEARKACEEPAVGDVEACRQFTDDLPNSAACLQPRTRPRCVPHYWIRDYGEDPANCRVRVEAQLAEPPAVQPVPRPAPAPVPVPEPQAKPAPAPVPEPQPKPAPTPEPQPKPAPTPEPARAGRGGAVAPAARASAPASAASAPASAASAPAAPASAPASASGQAASAPGQPAAAADPDCGGKTIYLQIHGPQQRELARALRQQWRALGARVPPIEDVLQSARQDQREPPPPVATPTVIVHQEASRACAEKLRKLSGEASGYPPATWMISPLPSVLQSRAAANVIEVWLPSADRAAAAR